MISELIPHQAKRERPILFSAPMVQAILEGRKTQTRRVVKNLPERVESITNIEVIDPVDGWVVVSQSQPRYSMACPYGQPGDRLWVRETWMECHSGELVNGHGKPLYRASWGNTPEGQRWKPSIHMPRWASRLNLEITGVRVERLQDITPEDAFAEGDKQRSGMPEYYERGALCHVDWYRNLWNDINGAGSWNLNPWVWVIEFRRLE